MASYRFQTAFTLRAPAAEVYRAIVRPERWLTREPRVLELRRLADATADALGVRYATTVSSTPYNLHWEMEMVEAREPSRVVWRARGDLDGVGAWELRPGDGDTEVRSTWQVRTTRRWMNLFAPLARPLFVRNHDVAMRAAVDALAGHLDVEVVRFDPRA